MLTACKTLQTQELLLSGNDWFIQDDPGCDGAARKVYEDKLSGERWIAASVPGNIQADLETARQLKPIWYGEGDERLWDVACKDWWYCKDFEAPQDFEGRRLTLVFDGVDFECEVWLNGQLLGANKGMFRRFWFDASAALKPGQTNRLAVRIARMPEEIMPFLKGSDGKMSGHESEYFFVYANNKIRRVLKDLKSPANCSYDWGTNIYTLGIWKDVRIEATGAARIEWTQVQTELKDNYTKATVVARLEVDSQSELSAQAVFTVKGHGEPVSVTLPVSLNAGSNMIEARIELDKPQLWWPVGSGAQPLYTLEATLEEAGEGQALDTRTTRFGVREVRWEQVEGAPADFLNPYRLVLNGKTIRTMGSNLVSPDLLFGRNFERGPWFMHVARFSGMNTLRLHGGGVTLPERMYELADELGLMISHEFPVANCIQESDPVYLENLDQTCRNILKQVRNHAAIIEYSGGNELNWKQGDDYAALHVMERVTAEEDNRFFRATCPIQGSRHSPWHYDRQVTYAHYDNEKLNDNLEQNLLMRYGEFGIQTPSNIEVWHREIPLASQWPIDGCEDPVLVRKNVVQAVFSDEFWLTQGIVEDLFGLSPDLESLIKGGQFIGGEGLRYAMDALRRRGKKIGGFTNWDYNEPWPNGAGSYIVDYDGRTLMDFDFFKQALAPVALNIKQDSILYDPQKGLEVELFMVSDAADVQKNLKWSWVARDRRGQAFAKSEGTAASIQPLEVIDLGPIKLTPPAKTAFGPLLLELTLRDADGQIVAERVHFFGRSGVRGSLRALMQNTAPDRDDDVADAMNNLLEKPDSPANLAYSGNGATVTASCAECADFDPTLALIDGQYSPHRVWVATAPMSFFQIDLGKVTTVGRFKVGRDRQGFLTDRALDFMRIEVSADGKQWKTLFEQSGLAALAGFPAEPSRLASWGPILAQLTDYLDYRPAWTLEVCTEAAQARYVKVTVDQKPGQRRYVAIDEFEVYAPREGVAGSLPSINISDIRQLERTVARTTLKVTAQPVRIEGEMEVLDLVIENTGAMTALFVEPHPVLNYRTDLLIGNKNICIAPGQTRTLSVQAPLEAKLGLGLAQTGWRVASWNADDVMIEPSADVLLSFGRQDAMTRGYLGYLDPKQAQNGSAELKGARPAAELIPYRLTAQGTLALEFDVAAAQAAGAACLRLHTADRSATAATAVQVKLNGKEFSAQLPLGLGIQETDPAHLAYPATAALDLPAGSLKAGANRLEVRVSGQGWLSWDALDLTAVRG